MPSSRFLVQEDDAEFAELMRHSNLPVFRTNLARFTEEDMNGRIGIPISDESANVIYHLIAKDHTELLDAAASDKNITPTIM